MRLCDRSQSLTAVLVLQWRTLRYNDHTSLPHTPKAVKAHMWPVHKYFILPAAKIEIYWCFLFYHKAQTTHSKERLEQHSFSTQLLFWHQTKLHEVILQCSTIIHSSLKSQMNHQLGIRTNKMKKITNHKPCGGQEMKLEAEKRLKLRSQQQQGMKLQTAERGKNRRKIFAWRERDTWYESNKTFQFTTCLPHSGKGEQAKEDRVQEIVSNVRTHPKGPVLFLPDRLAWPIRAGMKN